MRRLILLVMCLVHLLGCVPGVNLVLFNNSGEKISVDWCDHRIEIDINSSSLIGSCDSKSGITFGDGTVLEYENLDPIKAGYAELEPYIEYPDIFGRGLLSLQINTDRKIYVLSRGTKTAQTEMPEQPRGFPKLGFSGMALP